MPPAPELRGAEPFPPRSSRGCLASTFPWQHSSSFLEKFPLLPRIQFWDLNQEALPSPVQEGSTQSTPSRRDPPSLWNGAGRRVMKRLNQAGGDRPPGGAWSSEGALERSCLQTFRATRFLPSPAALPSPELSLVPVSSLWMQSNQSLSTADHHRSLTP